MNRYVVTLKGLKQIQEIIPHYSTNLSGMNEVLLELHGFAMTPEELVLNLGRPRALVEAHLSLLSEKGLIKTINVNSF